MESRRRLVSLGFDDERVPEGQHVCYIYNDDAERFGVITGFLRSGLEANEWLLCAVDTTSPDELRHELAARGLDLDRYGDALEIVESRTHYHIGQGFPVDENLATFRDFHTRVTSDPRYVAARVTGELGTYLTEHGDTELEAVLEFEARLNHVLAEHPCTTCCQDDARRIDGATVLDILAVHPMMIVHGKLMRNPWYREPEVFLAEYRRRRRGDRP